MVPKKVFFTTGTGQDNDKLSSFELALRSAKIEKFNLVKVSSIFPPKCKIISKEKGLNLLKPGQIVFCVMARNQSKKAKELISASVGLAMPNDNSSYGYLSEHCAFNESAEKTGEFTEKLAKKYLASTKGIDFKSSKINKNFLTQNVTVCIKSNQEGLWNTVVAAAVFIL